jgi:hypothetical protein
MTEEDRLTLQRIVPIIRREGRTPYVRLADIPEPWRGQFDHALTGSACPGYSDEGDCANAWDWTGWLAGSFPRGAGLAR